MARVIFTENLRRHLPCDPREAAGATVRAVLESALAGDRALRGYVLDEQGRLRRHVVVFVDGRMVGDREALSDPVRPGAEVYVMQALSGG